MGAMQAMELERGGPKTRRDDVDDAAPRDGAGWDTRFAALAEEHGQLLFRIAYGLLRNAHDAEDAVQEALLRIYKSGCNRERTGLRADGHAGLREDGARLSDGGVADEKAYLARTVWRAGLDIAARRPKRTESIDQPSGGDSDEGVRREFAASGRSAEEELAEGDERALLRRLIDALPEDLRQPLVLSAIEEMTSREVAAALSIPEGTVRTRVMRARTELRRRFRAMRAKAKSNHGFSRTDTDRA